ncbi:MAG: hypothetical protein QJR00_08575, partial [Bacillota bacterium]|nr:hypothetical protein [Bacillota bacterium]
MKGPILPLDEYHGRLWAGHFRFYLSLPLERRQAYRQLMKLYFPLLRTLSTFIELHLAYEELEEGPWYENRAQLL